MADLRVASRYVKSLLDLAVEQGALEEVHRDMKLFAQVCDANREFVLLLKSPVIRHDKKKNVLEKLFQGKVHKLTMAIFNIITSKNREPLLPVIAKEFHNAYNNYKNIGKASVTTAVALDENLRKEILQVVQKLSDRKQVELSEHIDPSIIGGFVLSVGDKQIDASIKNKIRSLKVKFAENPYVKEF